MELPGEVIDAVSAGRKIEAIKLLRVETGMGLAEAKAAVEAWAQAQPESGQPQEIVVDRRSATYSFAKTCRFIIAPGLLATFVWMMVNIVTVAGSLIVILNRDGYQAATFVIEDVYYHNDHENGLSWGFDGRLPDKPERMLAPGLADAESLDKLGLMKLYPPGTMLQVLYNPDVTDTLFQKRSLHIIPFVADIVTEEKKQLVWWTKHCVLPFVFALILLVLFRNKKAPAVLGD